MTTLSFRAPSGNNYTIREQNGEDEGILSNVLDSKGLMNITKFIRAIVVDTTFTSSGKLKTLDEVLAIPLLDRYTILLKSRIFSIGEILPFNFRWPNGDTLEYEQDLNEYFRLLDIWEEAPTDEVSKLWEEALKEEDSDLYMPIYLDSHHKDILITLASGKELLFDCVDGKGEKYLLLLSEEQRNRNAELIARNLRLKVDGKFEKVTNFSSFSVKDMVEIRNQVHKYDPVFTGMAKVVHPKTGEVDYFAVLGAPSFFYPTEA